MEKAGKTVRSEQAGLPRGRVVVLRRHAIVVLALLLLCLKHLWSSSPCWSTPAPQAPEEPLQALRAPVKRHSPSRGEIEWHNCSDFADSKVLPSGFECGTLGTPLDYTNSSDARNGSIAIIRYKAGGGNTSQSDVKGSLILNPGGPGGSGLQLVKTAGAMVDKYVSRGDFDIVSFDPRGVGYTWPTVECFDDPYVDLIFQTMKAVNGLPGDHNGNNEPMDHEIGTLIAEYQLVSDLCFANEDAELLQYMGTSFVARDMQLLHKALGDEHLNYWGFSYGSVLGCTYADMFPEDVGRVVIDGVVDLPNYYAGKWDDFFKDTEAELHHFFSECAKSGPEACELSKLASSGEDLEELVLAYGDKLRTHPIPVSDVYPPQLLTYTSFNGRLFQALYSPAVWPDLQSRLYAAIGKNNASALVDPLDLHPIYKAASETLSIIACSDALTEPFADNKTSWDISDWKEHLKPARKDTPRFSSVFGQIALSCSTWKTRSAERHWGNFTSQTRTPILALGNEFDPVTPHRYAEKMASLFPGARSVLREGYGHCTISQRSTCINDIIHSYLVNATLPEEGTKCPVDSPVFAAPDKEHDDFIALSDAIHRPKQMKKWNSLTRDSAGF